MATQKSIEKLLDSLAGQEFDQAQQTLATIDEPDLFEDSTLPIPITQFVDDPHYLGDSVKVEPQVMQLLHLIEKPTVNEAYIQVGKGSGKSLVGSVFPVYGAYILNSMRKPHLFFNLSTATTIATINVSIGQRQAKEVIFNQIRSFIEQSPWFNKNTRYEPLSIEISFPRKKNTIYCGHSNSNAFLGFATFRAVLDEANWMINNQNRDAAANLYGALKGSCTTRFPQHYKLVAISSASTPNAWLQKEVNHIQRYGSQLPLNPDGIKPQDYKHPQEDADAQLDTILEGILDEP